MNELRIDRVERMGDDDQAPSAMAGAARLHRDPHASIAGGDSDRPVAELRRGLHNVAARVDPHEALTELCRHPQAAAAVRERGRAPAQGNGVAKGERLRIDACDRFVE